MATITSTEAGATGRYINLGSPSSQDDIGAQTIVVYAKPSGIIAAGSSYFLGKTPSGGGGLRFFLQNNAGNRLLGFGVNSSGTANSPQASSANNAYAFDAWEHFQVTWDGSLDASNVKFYVGATESTKSFTANGTGSISSDAAQDLFLMNRGNAATLGRDFLGDLAYVARWNRVLSTGELANVRANGPLAVTSGLILCWANDQDYSANALTPSARSTRVTGGAAPNTALGDATATTLTGPSMGAVGSASSNFTAGVNGGLVADVIVTPSDGGGGTFVPTSVTLTSVAPSATFTYTAASAGAKTISISDNAGLTDASSVTYTAAASALGVALQLFNGATAQASITDIRALWWDAAEPTDAPVFETIAAATDGSGMLTLDLDGITTLDVGDVGFLLLYKADGDDARESLQFAGQIEVAEIV